MRLLATSAVATMALFLVDAPVIVRAQTTPVSASSATRFEVVSIRPTPPFGMLPGGSPHFDGGRWSVARITAPWLIELAYEVKYAQILGLPGWADDTTYAIEAKLPPNSGEKDLPQMLQGLLGDRFRLAFHRETKTIKVRTITVAKQGLKLRPATAACSTDPAEDLKLLLQRRRCGGIVMSAPYPNYRYGVVYRGFSVSMADIAKFFNNDNGREFFVDDTGLKGLYDVEVNLDYTPPPDLVSGSDDAAAFERAVFHNGWQNQAGLVLDVRQDRPIPVLVVEHLERPTPDGPIGVLK
jgi:uncharacterized protein (TIGR03435 family)